MDVETIARVEALPLRYAEPNNNGKIRCLALVRIETASGAVGWGEAITGSEDGVDFKARGRFYHYLRQNGLWTKEVTGFDPVKDKAKLDPYCPVRNVSTEYPPTLLVHGTEDTDVPYQLSADMAKELARHKVPHELVTVAGTGHGLAGGDPILEATLVVFANIPARSLGENRGTRRADPGGTGENHTPLRENVRIELGERQVQGPRNVPGRELDRFTDVDDRHVPGGKSRFHIISIEIDDYRCLHEILTRSRRRLRPGTAACP